MIGKKTITIISLSIALFLLIMSISFAADIEGTNVTFVSSSAGVGIAPATLGALGGNVTSVNINGSSVTNRWTGFFGNISGIVRLSDAAGNRFYSWTINVITGAVVYATNGTVSNWSTLSNTTFQTMPSYLQQTAADNYSRTFTAAENFTTNLRTIPGVDYAYTLNYTGQNSTFKTYAMTADLNAANDDNQTIVFAGKAVQQSNAFNNESVDFQIIAPARTLTTYYFYLELP